MFHVSGPKVKAKVKKRVFAMVCHRLQSSLNIAKNNLSFVLSW